MQWIALDASRQPVTASAALKQTRYFCPECSSPVQLRSGPHRQAHFYHVQPVSACTQHKKTEEHLGLQLLLLESRLNEMSIEKPFPAIRRIADIAWETRKIVFEIQCSPITVEEAKQRCSDYRSIGWDIVWILSDRRFNKKKLGAAEQFLRQQTSYFSAWSKSPLIYDQWEILDKFRRVSKGHRIAIDPLLAIRNKAVGNLELPLCIKLRLHAWKWRVEGDLLSQALKQPPPHWLAPLHALEKRFAKKSAQRLPALDILKRCYVHVFKKILHKLASRNFG